MCLLNADLKTWPVVRRSKLRSLRGEWLFAQVALYGHSPLQLGNLAFALYGHSPLHLSVPGWDILALAILAKAKYGNKRESEIVFFGIYASLKTQVFYSQLGLNINYVCQSV